MPKEVFVESEILGYQIASCCCDYSGVRQRWLVIESEKRRNSDLKQLEKKLTKQLEIATSELKSLMKQDFACPKGYRSAYAAAAEQAKQRGLGGFPHERLFQEAAKVLSRNWKYHSLESIVIETDPHYNQAGRPSKNQSPEYLTYRVTAQIVPVEAVIEIARSRAGRFILATNILDEAVFSHDEVLIEYKGQQSSERGFRCLGARTCGQALCLAPFGDAGSHRFLKDPLFFTSSVLVNTPRRVAALAMVMGLCLLVYTLGQRQLRHALAHARETIPNQLKKPTSTPTLR